MPEDLQRRFATLSYHETKPTSLLVELTYRCNQLCRHCYIRGMEALPELGPERLADVVSEAAGEGVMFVTVSGGEPTVRPDWRVLTDRIKPLKLGLRLFTNLTTVDDGTADYIAGLGLISVETTLFSSEPAVHDRFVRKPGAAEATVAGIRRLVARGVNVLVKHQVTDETWPTFKGLQELVKDLGAAFNHTVYIGPNVLGMDHPYCERPSDETVRAYFSWLYNGAKKINHTEKKDACEAEPPEHYRMGRVVTCMSGRNAAVLGADGTVYPCTLLRIPFGNVADRPFSEVWRSEAAEKFREYEREPLPDCEGCEYDAICRRCPGYSVVEDGGIDRPSAEHCRIARIEKEVTEEVGG